MKLSILTLGCRTNQAESLLIEKVAISRGHHIVSINEDPNLCIINTCSVTSKADYQSRQLIRRALKSNAKIILTGCYSNLNINVVTKNPRITIIPNNNKESIVNYLPILSTPSLISLSRARPLIKIQQGCNSNCSYCTIPIARGEGYSLPTESIIAEIQDYEEKGFNEIVLTGTNIGQYKDNINQSIVSLLKEILDKTKIARIRISSIEINYISKEFIEIIGHNRICKHLHIPLQSGSKEVLKAMRRPYLREEFLDKILLLKELYPNLSIGSDIIVGFPNEGFKEFNDTYSFLHNLPLSYFHVFTYSKRNNTYAAQMEPVSNSEDNKRRSDELINLSKMKKQLFIASQIGKETDFIIEKKYPHRLEGTTNNYIKTSINPIPKVEEKHLISIVLTAFNGTEVYGMPIV